MAKRVTFRARRDNNHNDIVGIFESLGASWLELSQLAGALDGLVGYASIDCRVEIKNPIQHKSKRKLTPDEVEVFETWRGRAPVIIETTDDAIELLQKMRADAKHLPKRMN
jgi:hypothetical protein